MTSREGERVDDTRAEDTRASVTSREGEFDVT